MAEHTGPAPLETPEDAARRMFPTFESDVKVAAIAIRARDAQWVARLEAMAEEADEQSLGHAQDGKRFPELRAEGAAAALRDAAKMGGGE